MARTTISVDRRKGAALLAVLWLSAALAAIAFSVATTVRSETERVSTTGEDIRAYYLAQGALDRALLHMTWPQNQSGEIYYTAGQPRMEFDFPSGHARVEIIPEASKINVNRASPELLDRLLSVLGVPGDRAQMIAQAIVDWRNPANSPTRFDQIYLSLQPSFQSRHASFEEIEELLSIEGMTPDIFYGTWTRDPNAGAASPLARQTGMRDCVTVFGESQQYDVNTVEPAVLIASGVSEEDANALVARRNAEPFLTREDIAHFLQGSPELVSHVQLGGVRMFTLRATGRLRRPDGTFSDLKRTVSALVKIMPQGYDQPIHVLRWYDRG